MSDDLSLIIGNQQLSGWTDIRVTRGIERLPSDFTIGLTELYPGINTEISIQPGAPCQIKIGGDLCITGYVDRFSPSISAYDHRIRVTGRGKCQDLVDCSAEYPNNQISNVSALGLAKKLAEPYGITVSGTSDADAIVQTYNLMWGETGYDVLEKACRSLQLLVYDAPDGNLLLSRVGTAQHSSGFTEGLNVISAEVSYSMDQRFSDYVVRLMSMSTTNDLGDAGDVLGTFHDNGVGRHRLRYIVVENGQAIISGGQSLATARGKWEAARRYGRSQPLRLVTDTWRDSKGLLWTPNMLVPLQLPSLKIIKQNWIIGDVSYKRDETDGTTSELLLMPPTAFEPEPLLLQPFFPDFLPAGTK